MEIGTKINLTTPRIVATGRAKSMLDVIQKDEYFAAMQKPVVWEFLRKSPNDLKHVQDAYIFSLFYDAQDLIILEAGGGDSRIIKNLPRTNELWNIDEFLGHDGGPAQVIEIPGVRTVRGRLGSFSTDLPTNYFDVLFSISVLEHLPNADSLCAFFLDGARVLKQGGVMHHAIDCYLTDESFDYTAQRIHLYLTHAQQAGLRFVEEPRVTPNLTFSCRYASNPDLSMFGWNNVAPSLSSLRLRAQSVSLKMALRKDN